MNKLVDEFLNDQRDIDQVCDEIRRVVSAYCGVMMCHYSKSPDRRTRTSEFKTIGGLLWQFRMDPEGRRDHSITVTCVWSVDVVYRYFLAPHKKLKCESMADKERDCQVVHESLETLMVGMKNEFPCIAEWEQEHRFVAQAIREARV